MIYNPNCSELVVPLDAETEEEIREALRAVERITGWKLCLEIELSCNSETFVRIRPEDIILDVDEDGYKELAVKEEIIPEKYLNSWYMKIVLCHPEHKSEPISIWYTDGYCERKTVLKALQHCYTPHFEPLAKVCKQLGKKFHVHDGGSPYDFLEWLEDNGYEGDFYEEYPD